MFILVKYPLGESWPYKWIFIYILCLINIHISFPNQAIEILLLNAYWKTITIPVIPENSSPIYQLFLEKFSSKNSKVYKKYNLWSHYCFFHPVISQFLIAAISFVTDCKELKIAQTCRNSQLFQLLHLICTYDDAFYGLTGVLMNKNLNNDVNKDSPIRAFNNVSNWHARTSFSCVILGQET